MNQARAHLLAHPAEPQLGNSEASPPPPKNPPTRPAPPTPPYIRIPPRGRKPRPMRQCTLLRRLLLPLERPGTCPSFARARLPLQTARPFSSTLRANSVKATAELERRINAIPLERFRNFCIVAHVVSLSATPSRELERLTGTGM